MKFSIIILSKRAMSMLSLLLMTWQTAFTQVSVVGVACVAPGVPYQYIVSGVDSATKLQFIGYDSRAAKLTYPTAAGGNCSPVYRYQWQRFFDQVDWTDVTGANDLDLEFSFSLQQPTFFRRKVKETVSGSIRYSDIATVFVNPPPGGSN